MFIPLDMGVYRWLCIVSSNPSANVAEVQVLDAPCSSLAGLTRGCSPNCQPMSGALLPQSKGPAHKAVTDRSFHRRHEARGMPAPKAEDTIEVTVRLAARPTDNDETISIMGRVVMAYPSNHSKDRDSSDAHVSFIDGQQEALEVVATASLPSSSSAVPQLSNGPAQRLQRAVATPWRACQGEPRQSISAVLP